MKEKLIEILKFLKIFPPSGFGKVTITFQDGKIIYVEIYETLKLE